MVRTPSGSSLIRYDFFQYFVQQSSYRFRFRHLVFYFQNLSVFSVIVIWASRRHSLVNVSKHVTFLSYAQWHAIFETTVPFFSLYSSCVLFIRCNCVFTVQLGVPNTAHAFQHLPVMFWYHGCCYDLATLNTLDAGFYMSPFWILERNNLGCEKWDNDTERNSVRRGTEIWKKILHVILKQ